MSAKENLTSEQEGIIMIAGLAVKLFEYLRYVSYEPHLCVNRVLVVNAGYFLTTAKRVTSPT